MTARFGRWSTIVMLTLAGCATTRSEKPVITAKTTQAIARACGVAASRFHRERKGVLPYVTFDTPLVEDGDGAPSPSTCVNRRLAAYRYQFVGFAC